MRCSECKRPLISELSRLVGLGPVCAKRRGRKEDAQRKMFPDLYIKDDNGDIRCSRAPGDGQKIFNFRHTIVRHSPTGMEWGYAGSGPADFALNALLHVMGTEPAPDLYHCFKFKFVATLPVSGGTIKQADIRSWLATQFALPSE